MGQEPDCFIAWKDNEVGTASVARIDGAAIAAILKRNVSPALHAISEVNRDVEVTRMNSIRGMSECHPPNRHVCCSLEGLELLGHVTIACALEHLVTWAGRQIGGRLNKKQDGHCCPDYNQAHDPDSYCPRNQPIQLASELDTSFSSIQLSERVFSAEAR